MPKLKTKPRIDSTRSVRDVPGHALAMNLRCAYLAMHRVTNACFAEMGLSADSFTVLTALAESGCITQKELVQRIGSDANTVSAMCSRLERCGLLVRNRDDRDGRARLVELTHRGRRIQQQLWDKSQYLRTEIANLFDEKEQVILVQLLKRIAEKLASNP